jgi:hypothetical protein
VGPTKKQCAEARVVGGVCGPLHHSWDCLRALMVSVADIAFLRMDIEVHGWELMAGYDSSLEAVLD